MDVNQLVEIIKTSENLIEGSLVVEGENVKFSIQEFSRFDVVATFDENGNVYEVVDGSYAYLYTVDEYRSFLRLEEGCESFGKSVALKA